jgi:hypothetical protein
LRFGAVTRQYGFGGVNLRKDAVRSFIKFLPFFSQRETASAAGNQLGMSAFGGKADMV